MIPKHKNQTAVFWKNPNPKAVIYCSVKSQNRMMDRLTAQLRICREYVAKNNLRLISEVTSCGAEYEEASLQNLLQFCLSHRIKFIVATSPKRITTQSEVWCWFNLRLAVIGAELRFPTIASAKLFLFDKSAPQ